MSDVEQQYIEDDDDDIPYELVCPITQQMFRDPVMDKDGRTFERQAILTWLARKGTCPLTRKPAKPSNYIRNVKIKSMVRLWHLEHSRGGGESGDSSSVSENTDEDDLLVEYDNYKIESEGRDHDDITLFMFDIPESRLNEFILEWELSQPRTIPANQQVGEEQTSSRTSTTRRQRRRRRFRLFR